MPRSREGTMAQRGVFLTARTGKVAAARIGLDDPRHVSGYLLSGTGPRPASPSGLQPTSIKI